MDTLCEISIDYLTKAVQWHVIELGISVELLSNPVVILCTKESFPTRAEFHAHFAH